MHILISNDDGYLAPGLGVLVKSLQALGKIIVVAPERNRSGSSNSLTLDRPLSLRQASNGFYYVNGTPTDCVHLLVTGMMDFKPDIIVSGINSGANMGDDTIYSGTVAAAMEGYLLGLPSFAISLAGKSAIHFDSAGKVAHNLVKRFAPLSISEKEPLLLNINVPDIPYAELANMQLTRLGRRHQAEKVLKQVSPRNEPIYWVGPPGDVADAGPGTDFYAVSHNSVSITPLQADLTHHQQMSKVKQWLKSA